MLKHFGTGLAFTAYVCSGGGDSSDTYTPGNTSASLRFGDAPYSPYGELTGPEDDSGYSGWGNEENYSAIVQTFQSGDRRVEVRLSFDPYTAASDDFEGFESSGSTYIDLDDQDAFMVGVRVWETGNPSWDTGGLYLDEWDSLHTGEIVIEGCPSGDFDLELHDVEMTEYSGSVLGVPQDYATEWLNGEVGFTVPGYSEDFPEGWCL